MLLLLQQNLGFAWGAVGTVTVPDVVGDTEAAGTAEIEALGLTVTATTANSSSVAAGLIISQSPAAGAEVAPGSAVAIVVSLGDATQPTGGWYQALDREYYRRKKRKEEEEALEREEEEIKDEIDRNIAALLHEQLRKDEERKDLERLKTLVKRYEKTTDIDSERVLKALDAAKEKATRANLERLQREYERMVEEEDFMTMLLMVLHD